MKEQTWKISKWVCPKCKKKIISLYPKQITQNINTHKKWCKGDLKRRIKNDL